VYLRYPESDWTKPDVDGHTIVKCSKPKDDTKAESSFDISDTFATTAIGENSWEKASAEWKEVEQVGEMEASGW